MNTPELTMPHDLGGARGFGAVDRSRTAQFANEWEASVFGMTLACGMLGQWNLDQSRSAREQMEPEHYLAAGYYEHWLHGLELLLLERGLLSEAELRSGKPAGGSNLRAVAAEQVAEILDKGAPTLLPAEAEPAFTIGDRVRVRMRTTTPRMHNRAHTRAPRYTRGRQGVIVTHHGAHIFPDRHAASGKKQPQHLYGVRFEAEELWGEAQSAGRLAVYADLFEPYLEAANGES